MLHCETLPPSTLDLLITLCAHPEVAPFALTGGTALALRFGHRFSVDLDFFTPQTFDTEALAMSLTSNFRCEDLRPSKTSLSLLIRDVRVDFVQYRYPLLDPFESFARIRLFGLRDNIGMKLAAITNRGAKKDFFDAHRLIMELGLPALLQIYQAKYPSHDVGTVLRSLVYFDDAEDDPDPTTLDGTSWSQIKTGITKAVSRIL